MAFERFKVGDHVQLRAYYDAGKLPPIYVVEDIESKGYGRPRTRYVLRGAAGYFMRVEEDQIDQASLLDMIAFAAADVDAEDLPPLPGVGNDG